MMRSGVVAVFVVCAACRSEPLPLSATASWAHILGCDHPLTIDIKSERGAIITIDGEHVPMPAPTLTVGIPDPKRPSIRMTGKLDGRTAEIDLAIPPSIHADLEPISVDQSLLDASASIDYRDGRKANVKLGGDITPDGRVRLAFRGCNFASARGPNVEAVIEPTKLEILIDPRATVWPAPENMMFSRSDKNPSLPVPAGAYLWLKPSIEVAFTNGVAATIALEARLSVIDMFRSPRSWAGTKSALLIIDIESWIAPKDSLLQDVAYVALVTEGEKTLVRKCGPYYRKDGTSKAAIYFDLFDGRANVELREAKTGKPIAKGVVRTHGDKICPPETQYDDRADTQYFRGRPSDLDIQAWVTTKLPR